MLENLTHYGVKTINPDLAEKRVSSWLVEKHVMPICKEVRKDFEFDISKERYLTHFAPIHRYLEAQAERKGILEKLSGRILEIVNFASEKWGYQTDRIAAIDTLAVFMMLKDHVDLKSVKNRENYELKAQILLNTMVHQQSLILEKQGEELTWVLAHV